MHQDRLGDCVCDFIIGDFEGPEVIFNDLVCAQQAPWLGGAADSAPEQAHGSPSLAALAEGAPPQPQSASPPQPAAAP